MNEQIEKIKEEFYNKANIFINQIIGRATMLRNTEEGKTVHEISLKLAELLDNWINKESVTESLPPTNTNE